MPLWLVTIEWTIDRQMQPLLDVIALTCGMLGLGMVASGTVSRGDISWHLGPRVAFDGGFQLGPENVDP